MTEEQLITMARSYGLRISGPEKGGQNIYLYLGTECVGEITDVIVFGCPEKSGRTFTIKRPFYCIEVSSDSCLLADMTEERFREMLLSNEKLAKPNLEDLHSRAQMLIESIDTLQGKLMPK